MLLVWTPTALAAGVVPAAATAFGVRAVSVVRQDWSSWRRRAMPTARPWIGRRPVTSSRSTPSPSTLRRSLRSWHLPTATSSPGSARATWSSVRRRLPAATRGRGDADVRRRESLRVSAVVADSVIGGAEAAVSAPEGRRRRRGHRALRAGRLQGRALAGRGRGARCGRRRRVAVRFRTAAETPYLRAGDAVLPQVFLKERFGEFSYRPGRATRSSRTPPGWRPTS